MRYTNKNSRWSDGTVPMTVRVIKPVADVIDKVVADETEPELLTRSDVIQHALAVFAMERDD